MKNNVIRIILILCLCTAVYAVWDKDKPSASTSLRSSNPEILANWSALETAIGNEHEFSTGGANTGDHTQGQARSFSQATAPATQIDGGSFASTDLGSLWVDTDDNAFYMLTATTPTWTPVSTEVIATLLAANRIFAGTLKSTGDFTVGANKVVVTAANGNTAVAGTLGVTGVATLGDTSALATSGAPVADAQIANKKYVDDAITAADTSVGAKTTVDDDEATMVVAHAYLCNQGGIVECIITEGASAGIDVIGYDDSDTNPASGGDVRGHFKTLFYGGAGQKECFSFLMQSGRYFEITASFATVVIRWIPFGTLIKCTDQD